MQNLDIKEHIAKGIEVLMYGDNAACNYVLEEDWDVLIILDAARYDVFKEFHKLLNLNDQHGKLEYRISCGPPTARFVKENFLRKDFLPYLKNLIYVSANPVVDATLGKYRQYFYRYVPVWKFAWNKEIETVLPQHVAYYAFKVWLRKPRDKKLIIHFLQPHYPFILKKYYYVNELVRKEMEAFWKSYWLLRSLSEKQRKILNIYYKLKFYLKPLIKYDSITDTTLYTVALSKRIIEDVVKAYMENLIITLPFVRKILQTFSGRLVVTSDHGEAFGEYINKFVPIRVFGHLNRIRLDTLVKVPWYVIENDINHRESLRRAFKNMLKLRLKGDAIA
jgi:hypothetical protein